MYRLAILLPLLPLLSLLPLLPLLPLLTLTHSTLSYSTHSTCTTHHARAHTLTRPKVLWVANYELGVLRIHPPGAPAEPGFWSGLQAQLGYTYYGYIAM